MPSRRPSRLAAPSCICPHVCLCGVRACVGACVAWLGACVAWRGVAWRSVAWRSVAWRGVLAPMHLCWVGLRCVMLRYVALCCMRARVRTHVHADTHMQTCAMLLSCARRARILWPAFPCAALRTRVRALRVYACVRICACVCAHMCVCAHAYVRMRACLLVRARVAVRVCVLTCVPCMPRSHGYRCSDVGMRVCGGRRARPRGCTDGQMRALACACWACTHARIRACACAYGMQVNDPFVMAAWANDQKTDGKVGTDTTSLQVKRLVCNPCIYWSVYSGHMGQICPIPPPPAAAATLAAAATVAAIS